MHEMLMGSMTSQIVYEYPCEFHVFFKNSIWWITIITLLLSKLQWAFMAHIITTYFSGVLPVYWKHLIRLKHMRNSFFFFSNYHEGYLTIILIRTYGLLEFKEFMSTREFINFLKVIPRVEFLSWIFLLVEELHMSWRLEFCEF